MDLFLGVSELRRVEIIRSCEDCEDDGGAGFRPPLDRAGQLSVLRYLQVHGGALSGLGRRKTSQSFLKLSATKLNLKHSFDNTSAVPFWLAAKIMTA